MLERTMLPKVRYHRLPTEQSHPRSRSLDRLSLPALLRLMQAQDAHVLQAVRKQHAQIARAIELITQSLREGGRLFFVGAGTSGRLGVLEAAECPPTFHTSAMLVQAIMAGGRGAVFRSREGAEDDRPSARRIIRSKVKAADVVVGISASGVTPFVDEALRASTRRGATPILITCHPRAPISARLRIVLRVGPEILTGSTRLKAGTATKLVLNMLTLGAMAQLGKTYGQLMVDVRPTSRKLTARAIGIIRAVTHQSDRAAATALRAAHGRVKLAILMAHDGLSYAAAWRRLQSVNGSLRRALAHRVRPLPRRVAGEV